MEELPSIPIVLPANQPPARFYRGGAGITRFRGTTVTDEHTPEDWIGSVTNVRDEDPVGKTVLENGRLLVDAVDADPTWWLGKAHVASYGNDPRLLVKLLDAGQRLPIHAHPSDDFAHAHLGTHHGKSEAWHILTPGTVYLGLKRDISREEMLELVASQNTSRLLQSMHDVVVRAGDRVFVPPGTLHAIGEGILLAEVQQPEDLSILLEWTDFAIDGNRLGHLGLGFPTALAAVDHNARTTAEIERLIRRAGDPTPGLIDAATKYFRLEQFSVDDALTLEPGFAIVIILKGHFQFSGPEATINARTGATILLPAATNSRRLVGEGTVLVARPPRP